MPTDVDIAPLRLGRFREVLEPERYAAVERAAEEGRRLLAGRVVWNLNSTARGGGVAELLRSLVGYARGAGVDTRWVVIDGPPEFFAVTKRIHNRLNGSASDGDPLDEDARRVYEQTLARNLAAFSPRVRAGDVVVLHDPQTIGLVPAMREAGTTVIWRCHIGVDAPNDVVRATWDFLRPYLREADAYVFSRGSFAWEGLDPDRVVVIPPSIDVLAAKNVDLDPDTVGLILRAAGLLAGGDERVVTFARPDGTRDRIDIRATVVEDEPLAADAPVVLQVSRWDALKDPVGVIQGFAEHVPAELGAHLVYAGPAVEAVADDPSAARVLEESIAARAALPDEPRRRVHLATVPLDDPDENAIVINALQRHARVVAQKSLAEGFGLTVAEGMWKARPVVASRIGGIQDQVVDGDSGLLLDDPNDLAAFGAAVAGLLADPSRAEHMGRRAREQVRERFTSARSLLDYLALVCRLLTGPPVATATVAGAQTPNG